MINIISHQACEKMWFAFNRISRNSRLIRFSQLLTKIDLKSTINASENSAQNIISALRWDEHEAVRGERDYVTNSRLIRIDVVNLRPNHSSSPFNLMLCWEIFDKIFFWEKNFTQLFCEPSKANNPWKRSYYLQILSFIVNIWTANNLLAYAG